MATKLELYNGALNALGERRLTSVSENALSRRVLDEHYDRVLEECLEAADWNFAIETVKLAADTGVEPEFGATEVFRKPTDWVRTVRASADEYFTDPLDPFEDRAEAYFSSDVTPIYVEYVSNDTGLGLDVSKYPRSYQRYVELELATRICTRIGKVSYEKMEKMSEAARKKAKNRDAMNDVQPKHAPAGNWNRSRYARSGNRDRGNRNSLLG